jgi:hypothetical protein
MSGFSKDEFKRILKGVKPYRAGWVGSETLGGLKGGEVPLLNSIPPLQEWRGKEVKEVKPFGRAGMGSQACLLLNKTRLC